MNPSRSIPVLAVSLLPALLAGTACQKGVVPAEWTLGVAEVMRLGDGDAPEEAFYQPVAIAVDGAGRLHVLDSGNARVQVFGANGTYLATLGGPGEGPGDLSRPSGMWVFADGEVVIADTGNARLQRYGPGGRVIGAVSLDFLPLDVVGTDRHLWVVRLPPPTLLFGADPEPLVHQLDRDGAYLAAYVAPEAAAAGVIYFLRNSIRLAATPGGGFALAHTHVRSAISTYAATGALERDIPVLYKAQGWAPLGEIPREVNEQSLDRIARTASALHWDERRQLYWLLAGYVDRLQNGEWVSGTELYRYDVGGTYRGSVVLPFSGRAVTTAPDGTLWVLDSEGVVHNMRLHDPEMAPETGSSVL